MTAVHRDLMVDAGTDIPATGEAVRHLLARQEVVEVVRETLRTEGRASVEGLWGSSAPALAAALLSDCPSTLLYVLSHIDSVDDARDEWRLFADIDPAVFPAWESLPSEADVSDEILAERLRILKWLAAARQGADHPPRVLVTTIQAIMQPVPSPRHLDANTIELVVGQDYDLAELRAWLAARGFRPAELVLEPGQYAARGGIMDVFAPTAPMPYRLEFFGDTLESLRTFDPTTQRSLDDRDRAAISFLPTGKGGPVAPETTTNLMEYLPRDAWVVWQDPLEIAEVGRSFVARLVSPVGVYAFDAVVRQARAFRRLDLSSFTSVGTSDAFLLRTEGLPPFSGKAEAVREELAELVAESTVLLFSDNEGERDRLAEILSTLPADVSSRIRLGLGRLGTGFRLVSERVAVLANHEMFQRYQLRRRLGKRIETRAIDTWLDLKRGDYVVHVVHGIGRYLGMKTLRRGARTIGEGEPAGTTAGEKAEDYLTLEFRDHVKVYVPASEVDLVQKYIGGAKGKPLLSRVGGKAWGEKKRRVEAAVEHYAVELLRVQALRQSRPGIAYPEDSLWQ
ncbi:MAG: hypothetical protein NTU94_11670 [Planctomycetota bacterium]|nr:hypothetical protein [Planctomycetota bacterium]